MISHPFESANYSSITEDPYGSKNIQLESFLSRIPYELIPKRLVGCYSSSYKSQELDSLSVQFLTRMMDLQKRVLREHPLKFRKQQRLVFGMGEIAKFLSLGRVKSLFVATNLDDNFINSKQYREVLQMALQKQIPIVWSCSRNKFGDLLCSRVAVSMVAVMFDDGVQELHREIVQLTEELKTEWTNDLLKLNFNPYSRCSESLLWISCFYGHLETVKLICNLRPDLLLTPDSQFGMLPVHVCASNGNFECFLLVQKGLLEEKTFQLKDACYLAVENGHDLILKFIIDKWKGQGIDLFERLTSKYISGFSLATLSVKNEHQKCFALLVDNLKTSPANYESSLQDFILGWMCCASASKNVPIWNLLLSLFQLDVRLLAKPSGVVERCFVSGNVGIVRMLLHFIKQHLPPGETMQAYLMNVQIGGKNVFAASKGTIFERDFWKFARLQS